MLVLGGRRRHEASRREPKASPGAESVTSASFERHTTVMRASRAGRMASAGPGKRHFCQGEPRLATIMGMGRKDKGREICINCGQTFHKKLTSKELRCTKCRKAEKKAA